MRFANYIGQNLKGGLVEFVENSKPHPEQICHTQQKVKKKRGLAKLKESSEPHPEQISHTQQKVKKKGGLAKLNESSEPRPARFANYAGQNLKGRLAKFTENSEPRPEQICHTQQKVKNNEGSAELKEISEPRPTRFANYVGQNPKRGLVEFVDNSEPHPEYICHTQ